MLLSVGGLPFLYAYIIARRFYGLKGIIYGLPVAVLITYIIYKVTGAAFETAFYIPWSSVAIAVGSVFVVVFATMLYATRKIRNDNPIDALKNENI